MLPAVGIIVVAAGLGTRLGAGVPKAFAKVAGMTLLEHALASVNAVNGATAITAAASHAQIVIVVPESHLKLAEALAPSATVVVGADSRQGSVACGLAALESGIGIVLVHDAARAFTPAAQFERVAAAVRETGGGVIPSLPVSDTIKRVADAAVLETVDRSALVLVQTPQGFPRAELVAAYASATEEYTDDAALFAAAGHAVVTVAGDPLAFKITTPADLRRAEQELGLGEMRTGVGVDVHAYDASQPLWLGGLHWPDEVGLAGHSDGDAICHAMCDALLSAAGLGDIGSRFGTSDPQFAGAHGDVFLSATVELLAAAGFVVANVSVQLIANSPRLGVRRAELQEHLSALVGAAVSVAATTSDGLGFTGAGEGVAAIATALVTRRA